MLVVAAAAAANISEAGNWLHPYRCINDHALFARTRRTHTVATYVHWIARKHMNIHKHTHQKEWQYHYLSIVEKIFVHQ